MRKILALLLCGLIAPPAWAGSSTVNYNSTGSSPFATTTDGSSNNYSRTTIWDQSAAAYGATVDSSNNLHIDAPSGSALLNAITAAVPCQAVTAYNTAGPYSTGTPNPTTCNLYGNLYSEVDVWGGIALGAPANFGTSPGAVKVPGVNASMFEGTAAVVAEPCQTNARVSVAINLNGTSGLYTTPILVGTPSDKIYVCQLVLNNNAAVQVSIFEATTTSSCGSGQAALWGSYTAATGFQFAANGGVSLGVGGWYIKKTATANDDICAITNSATQITGSLQYVVAP